MMSFMVNNRKTTIAGSSLVGLTIGFFIALYPAMKTHADLLEDNEDDPYLAFFAAGALSLGGLVVGAGVGALSGFCCLFFAIRSDNKKENNSAANPSKTSELSGIAEKPGSSSVKLKAVKS